jgi:hypothetical protein
VAVQGADNGQPFLVQRTLRRCSSSRILLFPLFSIQQVAYSVNGRPFVQYAGAAVLISHFPTDLMTGLVRHGRSLQLRV